MDGCPGKEGGGGLHSFDSVSTLIQYPFVNS